MGSQRSYSMPPWCNLGNLALSLRSHLGASSKSSCFFCWATLVFSGGPQCSYSILPWSNLGHLALSLRSHLGLLWCRQLSYSMQPWCHLGNLALSLSSHLWASSKSYSFFFWAILVFSGGPPCTYTMPLWYYLGHLPLALSSHLGLLWGPQCPYSMPPWRPLGKLALPLSSHLGASSKSSSVFFLLSWSSLEVPHVCTRCHCGLTMPILLYF